MNNKQKDFLFALPIAICIIFVPLVLRYTTYINASSKIYYPITDDFIAFPKAVLTIILGAICLALIIIYNKKIKFNNIIKLLFLYALFIFASTINSEYKDVAIFGLYKRNEGMLVLISYLILLTYTYFFIDNNYRAKIIFVSFVILIILFFIIGLSQFWNKDIIQSSFIKSLILPKDLQGANIASHRANRSVYLTLNSTNYVGFFGSFSFSIMLGFFIISKKIYQKTITGILCLCSFFILLASFSKAGYISGFVCFIIIFIAFIKKIRISFFILVIGLLLVYNYVDKSLDKTITQKVIITYNEVKTAIDILKPKPIITEQPIEQPTEQPIEQPTEQPTEQPVIEYKLVGIKTDKNTILVESTLNTLIIKRENDLVYFIDANQNELAYDKDENNYLNFTKSGFIDLKILLDGNNVIVSAPQTSVSFDFLNQNYKVINANGIRVDSVISETAEVLKDNGQLFSGRGFIWAKSIPLIKQSIFIGSGPDTFIFRFPQNDFVSKSYNGYNGIIVDKPHSLYLQIAIQTGFISLIVFFLIIIYYIFGLLRNIKFFGFDNNLNCINFILFVAILSYLITSISNDSIVGTSPLFWICQGLGFGLNFRK